VKLELLEEAAKLVRICQFTGAPLLEAFRRTPLLEAQCEILQQLVDDGQFYVLLDLKRSEQHAFHALERIEPPTEYLRPALEEHLRSLQTLLEKVEAEEALRRDRAALLSTLPPPDPDHGVSSWISGKTPDPASSS
jgi:hypothetical protein